MVDNGTFVGDLEGEALAVWKQVVWSWEDGGNAGLPAELGISSRSLTSNLGTFPTISQGDKERWQ